jgi:molecular chaperone GrpE
LVEHQAQELVMAPEGSQSGSDGNGSAAPPMTEIPDTSIPEARIPEVSMPEVSMPEVSAPSETPTMLSGSGDAAAGANGDAASPNVPPSIESLLANMERRILEAFEQKLAFDETKEKQIDRLHGELQGYRTDLVGRTVKPVLLSLIRLHDDFGKVLDALDREDPAKLTSERLLKLLKGFRDDVELALNHNGVQAFTVETEIFDPRRQRALRAVETTEQGQVGHLAARLRPGFEQGEAILERERVAVFALKQPKTEN